MCRVYISLHYNHITNDARNPELFSKTFIGNPTAQWAPQHSSGRVNVSVLGYGIEPGQCIESGAMHHTHLVQEASKAGRIFATPSSVCNPFPTVSRSNCYTHIRQGLSKDSPTMKRTTLSPLDFADWSSSFANAMASATSKPWRSIIPPSLRF